MAKKIIFFLACAGPVRHGSGLDTCSTDTCPLGPVGSQSLLQVDLAMSLQKEAVGTTASTTWASPYYVMTCPGTQALTTRRMTEATYDEITAEVIGLYDSLPSNMSREESLSWFLSCSGSSSSFLDDP